MTREMSEIRPEQIPATLMRPAMDAGQPAEPKKAVYCGGGQVIAGQDYSQPGHPRKVHEDGTLCDHSGGVSIGDAPPPAGVALLHADGTACRHDGKPQATMSDDGGPLCPDGQPVTHIRYDGRLLTIEEAHAALASMADTITRAIAPLAAAFAEFGRIIAADPRIRAVAAAAEVIEGERSAR
jgi:hypothetical protein